MSISVLSVSPRRDFFMNRAYEGTAIAARIATMATATISSTSVKPRMRLPAASAVLSIPNSYMSFPRTVARRYPTGIAPVVLCASPSLAGLPADGRSSARGGADAEGRRAASACELRAFFFHASVLPFRLARSAPDHVHDWRAVAGALPVLAGHNPASAGYVHRRPLRARVSASRATAPVNSSMSRPRESAAAGPHRSPAQGRTARRGAAGAGRSPQGDEEAARRGVENAAAPPRGAQPRVGADGRPAPPRAPPLRPGVSIRRAHHEVAADRVPLPAEVARDH